jgi:hypothetical protein
MEVNEIDTLWMKLEKQLETWISESMAVEEG